ncbi:hypothetical protein [Rubripirellula amarantea]|nr:hypothetical protein [Rubripirellula amarantea]
MSVGQKRESLEILERLQVADDAWAYWGVFDGGLIVRDLKALKIYRY